MLRFRYATLLLLVIAPLDGTCLGQGKPADIWGETIQAQPFDTAPFRQIKVPAWVQDTIGCGYTLSAMSSQARTAAAAHGVTISEMGFVDPFYAYYDSYEEMLRSNGRTGNLCECRFEA